MIDPFSRFVGGRVIERAIAGENPGKEMVSERRVRERALPGGNPEKEMALLGKTIIKKKIQKTALVISVLFISILLVVRVSANTVDDKRSLACQYLCGWWRLTYGSSLIKKNNVIFFNF